MKHTSAVPPGLRITRHFAYQHTPALLTECPAPARILGYPFRSPSDAHSPRVFIPPSHHRRLAAMSIPEATYASSSVSTIKTHLSTKVKSFPASSKGNSGANAPEFVGFSHFAFLEVPGALPQIHQLHDHHNQQSDEGGQYAQNAQNRDDCRKNGTDDHRCIHTVGPFP